MGANYLEEWDTDTWQEQDTGETWRNVSSTFIAFLAGAYLLFKVGELVGFPVWLWLHQVLQMLLDSPPVRISLQLPVAITNRLRGQEPSENDDLQTTEMQRNGGNMLSSMFGLSSSGLLKKGVTGLAGALSKSYSNVPPGLGNISNSCYQNSIVQGLASLPTLRDYLSKTSSQYQLSDSETTTGALFELINKLNDPENHGHNFWINGVLKSMSTWQQQDAQEYYSKVLESLDKEVLKSSKSKRETAASWLLTAKSLSDSRGTTEEGQEERSQEARNLDGASDTPTPSEQLQVPSNPLNGLQAQRVGCIVCGYTEGLSMTPFTNLTVPLGNRWTYDIRECLDEVTNLELIQGVECAKCTLLKRRDDLSNVLEKPNLNADLRKSVADRLEIVQDALDDEDFEDATLVKKCLIPKKNWVKSTKSRQAVIARAPKSLVLHVNRSVFDEYTGAQLKNTAQVHFPKLLDLGLWCLGSHPATDSQSPDESIEEWPRDPRKSILQGIVGDVPPTSPFQYDLRAVVTHYGRHENGHYIAYRRHPFAKLAKPAESEADPEPIPDANEDEHAQPEQWWRFSDDDVSAVSEDLVLNQGGVFMLFYERLDPVLETPLPSDQIPINAASVLPPLPPMDIGSSAAQTLVPVTEAHLVPLPDDSDSEVFPSPSQSPALPPMDIGSADAQTSVPVSEALETALPDVDSEVPPSPPLSPALPPQAANSPIKDASETPSRAVEVDGHGRGRDLANAAYPTPPPTDNSNSIPTSYDSASPDSYTSETDTAGYDSEDAPSTQLTSDDEPEINHLEKDSVEQPGFSVPHATSPSPHTMRAGDTPRRGNGSRASLPMVTAGY
ncbi:hypothetical protein BDV96DRAFT_582185 [Lophiotrema nucula]|uniref:ubiquitinyl hydrolase 1 n=1 Tax=Lophiotrema nucula TaxID=690887 RepID=A0A6A5YZA7_9PLEO|nr:hypothetical protein BDV96DRAFT_582185 [Lophiotrema nucula]